MASAASLASALRSALAERGFFAPESLANYRWADSLCTLGFPRDDELSSRCYRDDLHVPQPDIAACVRRIETVIQREAMRGCETRVVELAISPAPPVLGGFTVSFWWLERQVHA